MLPARAQQGSWLMQGLMFPAGLMNAYDEQQAAIKKNLKKKKGKKPEPPPFPTMKRL